MERDIRIIDLSVPLGEATPMYPGDPGFSARRRIPAHSIVVTEITAGVHSGTHVDAPFHFIPRGKKISELPLTAFFGEAVCIEALKTPGQDVVSADIEGADIRRGDIVLFRTGWEERAMRPDYFQGEWPGLAPELVETLAALGVKAIGGDTPSADSPKALDAGAPGHLAALGRDMPIFEHLVNLSAVAGRRFIFSALPLRLADAEASPVRAVAILD
jgi:arylformamidase